MSQAAPLHVMLVDDHAVVREGYRRLLELEPGMRVVAEHGDADAAIHALEQGALPEVMVLDLSMPGRSGLEVLRHVTQHAPGVAVLVFTMHASPALVKQALRAGARGFVTKSSEPLWLVQAVRRVAGGECPVLSPDVAHAVGDGAPPRLTPRELEVLHLLLQGRAVDEIGQRMNLSHKTVANYQTLIRQKLGASTGIELLRAAQRLELTPP